MILPVKDMDVTSKWGQRILNGVEQFHDGIDVVGSSNDVFSIADGVCVYDFDHYNELLRWDLNQDSSAGNYVIIQHIVGNQIFFAKYVHLEKNNISLNQFIKAGQKIGNYGNVGYSFGPHLHFTIFDQWWNKFDPMKLLA